MTIQKTEAEARKAVAGMFYCFPLPANEAVLGAKLEAYTAALDDLTPDEICAVCARASRGEIGNPGFLPSAAELHQSARPKVVERQKPSPDWRPHQERFLASDGTLYVTENNRTVVYTPTELAGHGYALPKPPVVLNREELEARGVASLHRLPAPDRESISDPKLRALIEGAANGAKA